MKRLSLFIILVFTLLSINTFGQSTYIGKIFGAGTPQFTTDPVVPCPILWLETSAGNYILSFDSLWIACTNLTVEGIEYGMDDEVEITGTLRSSGTDIYSVEHFSLEIETIKKLTSKVESTYIGKIISTPNPCLTTPCLPGSVLGLETDTINYVLIVDSNWCFNSSFSIENIEYFVEDEVEITGVTTTKQDVNLKEYTELEIKTIKKLTSNVESTYIGKVIYLPNPCETEVCPPGLVLGLETDTIDYVLTVNSNWIWNDSLIFADIVFFIDDEVEITGITTIKQDVNLKEYTELEIKTIKKLTSNVNIETLPFNNKIYYDAVNQAIILDGTLQNQNLTLELYNTQGQIMLKSNFNNNSVNISNLPNGMYLCRLLQNGQLIFVDKIIKL